MEKVSKNIKNRRKQIGMSAEQLAKRVNISVATIYRYENGDIEKLPVSVLEPIAKALSCSPAYLMGWEDEPYSLQSHPDTLPIKRKRIPILGGIACGEPIYDEVDFEYDVETNTDIKADFAMRCRGDSMITIGIKDGYIVFIKSQPSVENGEVAAINIDGTFTLKRFFKYGDTVILRSENPDPAYKELVYTENDVDNFVILGKAIAFQGDIR